MHKILIILATLLLAISLVLGACTPPPEPTLVPDIEIPTETPEDTLEHIAGHIYMDGAILVKGNYEPIILIDNPVASNVSYQVLKDFLYEDTTDEILYLWASITKDENDVDFVCGDFAELLHNNAEVSGIRTGLVYVNLLSSEDHILNVFETIDKGIIFIDVTGQLFIHTVTPPWMVSFGEPKTWDKVAYLEKDKPMGFIEISVAELYGFTYEGYEKWQQSKVKFDRLFSSYGEEITGGQEKKLRKQADKLGGFFEEGEDIVMAYRIFWDGYERED